MKKITLILLPVFSLLISCDSGENFIESNEKNESNVVISSKAKEEFSGREMFDGIYLLHGDFTNKLPSLAFRKSLLETPIPQDEIESLHKFINNNYPSLYNEFESVIATKDAFEIQDLLLRTNEKILEFALQEKNDFEIRAYMDLVENFIDISNDPFFSSLDLSVHEDKVAMVNHLKTNYDISIEMYDKISNKAFARDGWAFASNFDGAVFIKNVATAVAGRVLIIASGISYNDIYGDKVLVMELVD